MYVLFIIFKCSFFYVCWMGILRDWWGSCSILIVLTIAIYIFKYGTVLLAVFTFWLKGNEREQKDFSSTWMFWSAIKFIYKLTNSSNAPPDTCFILSTDCRASRAELREIISMEGHICATFRNYQMEAFKWTDLQIIDSYVPWWLPLYILNFFRFWTQSMQSSVNHFRFSSFISGWQVDVRNMLLDQLRKRV